MLIDSSASQKAL